MRNRTLVAANDPSATIRSCSASSRSRYAPAVKPGTIQITFRRNALSGPAGEPGKIPAGYGDHRALGHEIIEAGHAPESASGPGARQPDNGQRRGAYMITATPARQIAAPMMS